MVCRAESSSPHFCPSQTPSLEAATVKKRGILNRPFWSNDLSKLTQYCIILHGLWPGLPSLGNARQRKNTSRSIGVWRDLWIEFENYPKPNVFLVIIVRAVLQQCSVTRVMPFLREPQVADPRGLSRYAKSLSECWTVCSCFKIYSTLAKKKELCWCLNKHPEAPYGPQRETPRGSASLGLWASAARLHDTLVLGPRMCTPEHLAWNVPGRVGKLDEEVKGTPGVQGHRWPCCHCWGMAGEKQQVVRACSCPRGERLGWRKLRAPA